ncbi:MAG: hypothetical protein GEU81_18605 [Nitriliruptorales bacterium]|nr:hypothetical protein [Nitriliruptorales bacterium]
MLLLNNADVERVLTMELCLEALDGVFEEMAAGEAVGMGRIDLYVPSQQQLAPYYRWAVMAGASTGIGYQISRAYQLFGRPRVFRTVANRGFYAATCTFRYSSWTSCGVR